jgi:D-alanyl-D-alanine carboxypeptidase/D-alanyl-D-alanine-endopeptidase (penicillin-binding protein 4)
MIRLRYYLLVLAGVIPCLSVGQSMPQLEAAIRQVDQDAGMRSAGWSITVMDAATGRIITQHNSTRSLATASTMKVLTTATALALLGPDFTFETRLEYDGELTNGILSGNLYIRGGGDPSLGSERLGEAYSLDNLMIRWTKAVKAAGILEVRGRVVADDRACSTQLVPDGWNWEDIGNYYGAGAGAINVNENAYRLDLRPGARVGSATEVLRTDPVMEDMVFVNELTTGAPGSGDNAYIYGAPYTAVRYLRGTIPAGVSSFSIKGSMADPALYAARRLTEELILCGIKVSGAPVSGRTEQMMGRSLTPGFRKTIDRYYSPPLRDLVYHTNLRSINLYAEALALQIAAHQGKTASTAQGAAAIEAYWKTQGVDTEGMSIQDGSGLTPSNAVTTLQMASILCRIRQAGYYEDFRNSLPVAGQTGTLKGIGAGTLAEGRIRAKSGTIEGVRAYAGYAELPDGRVLAFSMTAQHFSCTSRYVASLMETLMVRIVQGK